MSDHDYLLSELDERNEAIAMLRQDRDTARARIAELERETETLRAVAQPFKLRAAQALADEVDVLVRRKVIDARSPAADALLDFRDPPSTERSCRLAELERERDDLRRLMDAWTANWREIELALGFDRPDGLTLADARKLRAQLETAREGLAAADRIMWMASQYAADGGSRGPEMRDYREAIAEFNKALAALSAPEGKEPPRV